MKITNHRICVFEFINGTFIRVAVPYDARKTFEEFFDEARKISWNGDENLGRGGLKSFTVGDAIHVPVREQL